MISSPQDIPILAVLAMSLSMYVVGMVCICCEAKCAYCPTSVKCIQVTISGCADDNGVSTVEDPCYSCGRLNGTFILYKRTNPRNDPSLVGINYVNPVIAYYPDDSGGVLESKDVCVYEANLPRCFKTEGTRSYGYNRYMFLRITGPTTAIFERGGLRVLITNLDCETMSGSGTTTSNVACGGSVSFHEIEQPCQAQTQSENTEGCCCYVQGVSQVSVTMSGWSAPSLYPTCLCGVYPNYTAGFPNCSALNGTWVSDLITTTTYPYQDENCSYELQQNCVSPACDAWGLTAVNGAVGCDLGSVCGSCQTDRPHRAAIKFTDGGVSAGVTTAFYYDPIWGMPTQGPPIFMDNTRLGFSYNDPDYCRFEALEFEPERNISWVTSGDPINYYDEICDRRSVTAEVVFT